MTEQEMAQKNMIMKCVTGSMAYGTNVASSDTDYIGIFVADWRYYIGLGHIEEQDLSTVSKKEDGKNASDAVDFKVYELRNFVKLAIDNNPNVLELFYFKPIFESDTWSYLRSHRNLFPWMNTYNKFRGYARAQKHKMMLKPENFKALEDFREWYETALPTPSKLIVEFHDKAPVTYKGNSISIGDLNFNPSAKMSKVYENVTERLSKATHRTDMYTKFGYDVKFAMHLIRLLLECQILMKHGEIEFPFTGWRQQLLLDIRGGKYTPEEIIAIADRLEEEIEALKDITKLPSKPRFNDIEKILMNCIESFHGIA